MKKSVTPISIIEIDARDARYQSGIGTYCRLLRENMPPHISTYNIVFYRSSDFKDIRIVDTGDELHIYHPRSFPFPTMFETVFTFLKPRLKTMPNLIVKSDCLACENLAYLIKQRIYCKTIGVLHCQPTMNTTPGFVPNDPFFNMDAIILVADNGRKYMDYWHCKRPYHVIYNGIDKPRIESQKPKDGVFRFIFANGLAKNKGFAKIIPAIRSVAAKHKIEVTVFGGKDPDTSGILDEIADLPVKYMGLSNDANQIHECYEQADAALFASRDEACSFAGIEAMAYNLPIVSSHTPGLVEMFGNAALFADMDNEHNINTTQYAAHMTRVIESASTRTRMAIAGYSRFLSRYTCKKMVSETIALYESLWK